MDLWVCEDFVAGRNPLFLQRISRTSTYIVEHRLKRLLTDVRSSASKHELLGTRSRQTQIWYRSCCSSMSSLLCALICVHICASSQPIQSPPPRVGSPPSNLRIPIDFKGFHWIPEAGAYARRQVSQEGQPTTHIHRGAGALA